MDNSQNSIKNHIVWKKKALKQLVKIDSRYQKSIVNKVDELTSFPQVSLDIKALQGQDDYYRFRVGDYRVIFSVQNGEPTIICIERVAKRTDQTYR